MYRDECCEECLNDFTCEYQENDNVEDCFKYVEYYKCLIGLEKEEG